MVEPRVITVTGVVVRDPDGRLLTVRKRGTHRFMLPGGKPEPGESAAQTGARECREEVGLDVTVDELHLLGHFDAPAANEAGHRVDSTVFVHAPAGGRAPTELHPAAEIADVRWMDPADDAEDLAPLLREHVLPALRATMDGMTNPQRLSPGDTAPDFTLATTHGELSLQQLLSSQREGVILYFYPEASTPGCTTQACDFRDSLDALQGAGYAVVGVSPDEMPALERFRDEQQLTYVLASDPDHAVLEAYGAWGEKQNYGKTYIGVIRSTVVIHPDGTVALAQYNVKATGHVARLRRELGLD